MWILYIAWLYHYKFWSNTTTLCSFLLCWCVSYRICLALFCCHFHLLPRQAYLTDSLIRGCANITLYRMSHKTCLTVDYKLSHLIKFFFVNSKQWFFEPYCSQKELIVNVQYGSQFRLMDCQKQQISLIYSMYQSASVLSKT